MLKKTLSVKKCFVLLFLQIHTNQLYQFHYKGENQNGRKEGMDNNGLYGGRQ